MRPLPLDWQALAGPLATRKRFLLLLDFDGTLAPLERTPRQARLPEPTRRLIRRLKGRPGVHVAVISGRSLRSIRSRVGLEGLYLAGNHGLEIQGPGFSFRHPMAVALKPTLRDLAGALRRDCRDLGLRGVIVENKGLTVSLHYRRLAEDRLKELRRLVRIYRLRTREHSLRWRTGHKVWELVPDVDWDKGRAALYLLNRLRRPFPIALGDDRTDEDMFRCLGARGVTIKIGCPGPSHARFCLASQRDTERFLEKFETSLNGGAR